jgi:hypothetical protein
MNLDFRSDHALAGARAYQQSHYDARTPVQRSYTPPSRNDLEPAKSVTAPAPSSPETQSRHAA